MATRPRIEFSKTAFIVVVALVVAAVIALRWSPGPDAPAAGDRVLAGVDSEDEPSAWAARLAYAGVQVRTTVGTRVDSAEVAATEGQARWVEVTWSVQPDVLVTGLTAWPGTSSAERAEKPSRLSLVADGRTYEIADQVSSGSSGGAVTIAVADADGLRLRLTSGGRKRPITRTERPTALGSTEQTASCEHQRDRGKLRFSASCTITATRAQYISGLGRPAPGKDWLVVTEAGSPRGDDVVANWWPGEKSDLYPRDSGGRVDYVAAGKPTLRLSVKGAGEPTATYGKPDRTAQSARLELRAYQVPSSEKATVRLTYETGATPDPRTERLPGSPARVTARAAGTLSLPAFAR